MDWGQEIYENYHKTIGMYLPTTLKVQQVIVVSDKVDLDSHLKLISFRITPRVGRIS